MVKSHYETDGPETFYIVDGLTSGHYYCFRVYAVNDAGVGEALVGKIPTRAKAVSGKLNKFHLLKKNAQGIRTYVSTVKMLINILRLCD